METTRHVLVTGASSGIGRASTELLAAAGWTVHATVRKETDFAALAELGNARIRPLHMEVTDGDSVTAARDLLDTELGDRGLQGLVNNAGIAVAAPLEFLAIDDFRRQLEVNLTGSLRVTQAFLPRVRAARGRIVNISSMAGRVCGPMLGAYHASKWGLEGLSNSLRLELAPLGVEVALIEPGAIRTRIWETAGRDADRSAAAMPEEAKELYGVFMEKTRRRVEQAAERAIDAEEVARAVLHALSARRPRTRYVVGRDARAAIRLGRWLPDRLFDRLILKSYGLRARR